MAFCRRADFPKRGAVCQETKGSIKQAGCFYLFIPGTHVLLKWRHSMH